jgi:hypothetical protein
VEYGYLERLIDEKKKEFGVNCSIKISTIKNCVYAGALTTHHGAKSPLDEVEEALVQICIQMGKFCQPLSCTEAIALMNNMIENTKTKQKLIEFHDSRKLETYGFEKGQVSSAAAHVGQVGAQFGGGSGVREGSHLNIKYKSYLLCQVGLGVAVNEQ